LALLKIDKMNIYLAPNNQSFNSGVINVDESDIYSGEETIRFNNRHPIYKSLMKIEFEEALRKYHKLILTK